MITIDALISGWRQIQTILEDQVTALNRGALLYGDGRADPAVTEEMEGRLRRWMLELRALESEYSVRLQAGERSQSPVGRDGGNSMSHEKRELYRSAPNGDRWSLGRESVSGKVFVEHEPNAASGGRVSRMSIADFLAHQPGGPEHQALVQLIGTLVERKTEAGPGLSSS